MLGFTHLTFGLFLEGHASVPSLALVALGSLFPDLDTNSQIAKVFKQNKSEIKHRGFLHAPFTVGVFFLLYYFIFRNFAILPFIIGYLSHIFLDALTKEGVPLLYPLTKKKFHIFSIKTGSIIDKTLSFFFLFFFILRFLKLF